MKRLVSLVSAVALAGCTTAPAPLPLPASETPLRTYSDDPGLADHLTQGEWRVPEDGTFDVLALSGGGPNGAFGAGVLQGWTERGDRPQFDHVTGVSTGALIAPFAYLGTDWDGDLKSAYLGGGVSGIMQRRILSGAFASSMFRGEPLAKLVDGHVTQYLVDAVAEASLSGRTLLVITTDLDAQRPVAWDMGAVARLGGERARTLFRDILIASASIPGVFPPIRLDAGEGEELHVDGGVSAPIYAVPEALADRLGTSIHSPAPVRIFMIANISVHPMPDETEPGTLGIMLRSLNTSGKASMRAALQMNAAMADQFGAEFQVMSIPRGQSVPITDFSVDSLTRLFDLGLEMGGSGAWREDAVGLID